MKQLNYHLIMTIGLMLCMSSAIWAQETSDKLFEGFQNPPAEARPFVRWWWNGNHIEAKEIKRELDVLKNAGIGGVEINPIAMPEEAKDIGSKPLEWLSKDWNELLALAAQEAQKRDMIADMIVGSGWPFGGEFLKPNEYAQKVLAGSIAVKGNTTINEDINSLQQKFIEQNNWPKLGETYQTNLFFIALVPNTTSSTSEVILLTDEFKKHNQLAYDVPEGNFELIYGIQQIGHRKVMHGALGASGYVMDHYSKQITLDYLNHLKKIAEDTGIPLSKLIRALFCDSIELAGANWTNNIDSIFQQTYQYDLKPYMPFIFYEEQNGYDKNNYSSDFQEEIKRVRYDYNKLLVNIFLENFTRSFQDFCTENGLKCRYQAYGTPFLMGMLEGYMISDIPESNNWIYSAEMNDSLWRWSKGHGYMIWNHYAAAGGHLTGRKIISCEAMTNTRGVFRTSLEEIKQHDDMNFISGINHTILHGFNYSPPEAGFPGWIRYGAYFSEQNSWWDYFPKWTNYNARLSYVFQNSQAQKTVAILAPTGDLWGDVGLSRTPFHYNPPYVYDLWETFSQSGSSCEYISEEIIQKATKKDKKLVFGPMEYEALMLCGVESMQPETAKAIEKYVQNGGKLILIDHIPKQSLSFQNADANDKIITSVFNTIKQQFPDQVFITNSPKEEDNKLNWTEELINQTNIIRQVNINSADPGLYQTYQTSDKKDIFFFVNTYRRKTLKFEASFNGQDKYPYCWDPETGQKTAYPYQKAPKTLTITLSPLQSLLLVFEDKEPEEMPHVVAESLQPVKQLTGLWRVEGQHVNGQTYHWTMDQLIDLSKSEDQNMQTFAGKLIYSMTFENTDQVSHIKLGEVHEGVTELLINGQNVGTSWYGQAIFPIGKYLKPGTNKLDIHYTTTLANYCQSLDDNPAAKRWANYDEKTPTGLEGPVWLLKTNE